MRVRMRWFTIALVVGFVLQSCTAGTVLGTDGQKCYPRTFSMSSGYTIAVYGDWIENIDRATGPSGVTVSIVSKENGAQNQSPGRFKGKGKVKLNIKTGNASPGIKTISLINDPDFGAGGETFTFPITVEASPCDNFELVWVPGTPGKVLGTEGQRCYLSSFATRDGSTISVFGNWIENIDRATASTQGVSVFITGRENGFQNSSGPFAGKGKVTLRINTSVAATGDCWINLLDDRTPGEWFSFIITIVRAPCDPLH